MIKKIAFNLLLLLLASHLSSAESENFPTEYTNLSINNYVQGQITDTPPELQKKYILTGGPGVGKTSIINCLQELGYLTVSEASTFVIKESQAQGISEPWAKSDFEDKVIAVQEKNYLEAIASKVNCIFFDRGPIDPITYVLRSKQVPNKNLVTYVQKTINDHLYDKTVFLIENLGFCKQDSYRVETNAQSIEIECSLEANYRALGFRIIRIPSFPYLEEKTAILERTKLILEFCRLKEDS